jgi:V/A-type H+-transporting ATPase subunit D
MPGIQKTNRMELLRVRRRLRMARRGHKLLQDKRDKLVQEFLRHRRQERALRRETIDLLKQTYQAYALARAVAPEGRLEATLFFPPSPLEASLSWQRVLNVEVAVCRVEIEPPLLLYGPLGTNADFDRAVGSSAQALKALAGLASLEGTLARLGREIEQTRRMVNNLEYIIIPEIESEERRIVSRLDLRQMENLSRLQRVKDIIRVGRGPTL